MKETARLVVVLFFFLYVKECLCEKSDHLGSNTGDAEEFTAASGNLALESVSRVFS